MKLIFSILAVFGSGFSASVSAEPWMASRYNKSCVACHTNPNGGGLRNYYGKWVEARLLRSVFLPDYRLNQPHNPGDASIDEDVARLNREQVFNAGADFRWFYLDTRKDSVHSKGAMPMATDVAASVSPTEHVSLVWESRYGSDPRATSVWDQAYTSGAQARSAYVLVNDLPLNGYAMYGIYRPMFGLDTPDHTTLFARGTGFTQNAAFKSTTVGVSPGVAFFNLHYIEPFVDHSLAQDRGFALNAGFRFTAIGGFAMFSYWDTKAKDYTALTDTTRKMTAFTGAATTGRLTTVLNITHINSVTPTVKSDSGTVITLEPRFRIWKESYLKGGWEYMNTGPNLRLGHARQLAIGASSYIISSLEVELMYKELKSTELDVGTREQNYWAQLHFFF